MERGLLSARVCVQESADGFDLHRDVARGTCLRSFERHVFEHVRDAHLGLGLVARAAIDPYAQRHAFELRHGIGDNGQAIGKTGNFDIHEAATLAVI